MKARKAFEIGAITSVYIGGFAAGLLLIPIMLVSAVFAPRPKLPEAKNVIPFRKRAK
jgi:hypothetical protein